MKDQCSCACACKGCFGTKMIVLGLIVLANAYWNFLSWATLIGILLILAGIIKFAMPCRCKAK